MIGITHNADPGSQVCFSMITQDKRSKLASATYNVVEIVISSPTFSMTTGFFLLNYHGFKTGNVLILWRLSTTVEH